ncbi:rod shape-determining protein MreD [Sphingomonas sp. AOB5]|uniref:rod shape-determining protein MreD n=1 Tax=Sphingomonas sp. AOB5 TaxID=3034017 RepID=UPI0023F893FE|nr:rod shape-determining protein MreD [Sphingomonas sp. AOB5]MDF7774036.1 rod shape-determining protein MreD [Sphingomonas sp. AOB5]
MRQPVRFVPLGASEEASRARWLAPLSVMIGSLVTILPFIAGFAWLPPFGLLLLVGWRLHRADTLKVWAAVPLGLFDDMFSGQPLGSAMLLWTLCFIAIDILDTRLVWRDYWQDWLIASGSIAFCLIFGRLIATPLDAHVETTLVLQIFISAALFPLITRYCAWLDRDTRG